MDELATIDTYTHSCNEDIERVHNQDCNCFWIPRPAQNQWIIPVTSNNCNIWKNDQSYSKVQYIVGAYVSSRWIKSRKGEDSTLENNPDEYKKHFTNQINWDYKNDEILGFISETKELSKKDQIDDCLDIINETFDLKLLTGDYLFCDIVLRSFDLLELNSSLLLGFLMITLPWKSTISSRSTFYKNVYEEFLNRFTEAKARRMLKGLD